MSEPSEWEAGYNCGYNDAKNLGRMCLTMLESRDYVLGYSKGWLAYHESKGRDNAGLSR